jgi:hypothetical protein
MKLSYNITGSERKALVGAISRILNLPAKYLGMPTAAYQIGEYTVDKEGTLTGPDNRELADALAEPHGFVSILGEYDEPADAEAEAWAEQEMRRMRLEDENVPDHSNERPYGGDGLCDYADLQMTEREELGLGMERREDWQGENGPQPCEVPLEAEAAAEPSDGPHETESPQDGEPAAQEAGDGGLTIEVPLDGFTPEKLDNLAKLVSAKAALLKTALGAEDLPIRQTAEALAFPWFPGEASSEDAKAYAAFVYQLCKTAKEKQRITAKEKEIEGSPKYAMRCFLLSLGMIGGEFKTARKLLLYRFSGSGAFKTKEREDAWKVKRAESRSVASEAETESEVEGNE